MGGEDDCSFPTDLIAKAELLEAKGFTSDAISQKLGPSGAIVNGRLHYIGYDASTEYVYNPEQNATEDDVYREVIESRASKAGHNLSPEDHMLLGMACLTL